MIASLLVAGLLGAATATTYGPPTAVTCPVDGARFTIRPAKTSLRPPMDRHLRHVRAEPVHRCGACGFVGTAADYLATAPSSRAREKMARWLRAAPPLRHSWQAHERSAELARLRGAAAEVVAWRLLQAAAVAPAPARGALRTRARDVMATADGPGARYAEAELSRQLGEEPRARAVFRRVLADPRAPDRLRRWADDALRGGGPQRGEDPHL